MVLVVVFVALPPVSVGGRGEGLKMGGVFDGPGGRWNIISIGWTWVNTSWGLRGMAGGSGYHTGYPSVKSCRLWVSKVDLLAILDGRKKKRKRNRKRSCWSGMNPIVSLVTKVEVTTEVTIADGSTVVETMEEIGLIDHWSWWRQEGQ